MERTKRSFYIMGHNPNTIEEAHAFLRQGANALEPDIVYADGQFYVSHEPQLSYKDVPTLQEYLEQLKKLLPGEQYNLALIVWDIKTVNFDPNHFMDVVKENFSGGSFDGVAMLITHADDPVFLNRYNGRYPNVGVGLDESNISPTELATIFSNAGQQNFSYADGITTLLNKTGIYKNTTEALHCRMENKTGSFGIVYTWVLARESGIRRYLDNYIDGIMVDIGETTLLRELIASPPYSEAYEMAVNGYNPFEAAPIPAYKLTVETKDTFMAGTNAQLLFTLTGVAGQPLKSLPYDASQTGGLERGNVSTLWLEGSDLGEIECLTVEALTDGLGADWLPGTITVESACLSKKVVFTFNATDHEEWVSKKGGSITKYPA